MQKLTILDNLDDAQYLLSFLYEVTSETGDNMELSSSAICGQMMIYALIREKIKIALQELRTKIN